MNIETEVQVKRQTVYTHLVLEGTAYEAGWQLGEYCKKKPDLLNSITMPFYGCVKCDTNQIHKIMELYDQYCPGLNEEIRGFAECVHAEYEDIVVSYSYRNRPEEGHCSHFAVPAQDQTLLHARSYEFCWGEDPILITSHIKGQAAQIGFGSYLFGRIDGMNEYGLSVTTASGEVSFHLELEGFMFTAIVRSLLNTCKNVEEAVAYLESVPIGEGRSYIIADAAGKAVLFEAVGEVKNYSYLSEQTKNYLYESNHFTLEGTKKANSNIRMHSQLCYEAIGRMLSEKSKHISFGQVKEFMARPIPDGPCCQHYIEGFGTMWSVIYEPWKGIAHICFGSPQYGEWHDYQLKDQEEETEYLVELIDEPSKPEFWSSYDSTLVERLIPVLRQEKEVTAIILDGGYDTDEAWGEEGINITLVVSSSKKLRKNYCIDFEGILVTLNVMEREELLKGNENHLSSYQNGFPGVLLYSKDESLYDYFQKSYSNREYDRSILLLRAGRDAVQQLINVKRNLFRYKDYGQASMDLIHLIPCLAQIEVNLNTEIPVRSCLCQAMLYNPCFFKSIYTDFIYDAINERKILEVYHQADEYLETRASQVFAPMLKYLTEQERLVGITEINDEIGKRYRVSCSLILVCEWLQEHHLISRGKTSMKITYGSKNRMEEPAYYTEEKEWIE